MLSVTQKPFYAECDYAECDYAEYDYAECDYAECHYAECHYAEFCGALSGTTTFIITTYR